MTSQQTLAEQRSLERRAALLGYENESAADKWRRENGARALEREQAREQRNADVEMVRWQEYFEQQVAGIYAHQAVERPEVRRETQGYRRPYVDPPAHAVVLSVDEKSQIQALDRTQPGLPMKSGRAGTMTHDYKRQMG